MKSNYLAMGVIDCYSIFEVQGNFLHSTFEHPIAFTEKPIFFPSEFSPTSRVPFRKCIFASLTVCISSRNSLRLEIKLIHKIFYEHPLVDPQVSHFKQVPLRTMVKLEHSPQASPV